MNILKQRMFYTRARERPLGETETYNFEVLQFQNWIWPTIQEAPYENPVTYHLDFRLIKPGE